MSRPDKPTRSELPPTPLTICLYQTFFIVFTFSSQCNIFTIFHFLRNFWFHLVGGGGIGMQVFKADVLLNSPPIRIPISFYFMEMADRANEVIE